MPYESVQRPIITITSVLYCCVDCAGIGGVVVWHVILVNVVVYIMSGLSGTLYRKDTYLGDRYTIDYFYCVR